MREYPTDEELELFIKQMEQQELYAPRHMKEQILSQAFPKQTVEVLLKSGRDGKSVRLFTYRLKVIAGMAAAIVMLMVLPSVVGNSGYEEDRAWIRRKEEMAEAMQAEEKEEMSLNYVLNEKTRAVNQRINFWFSRMDSLFETDGGNHNEN